MRRGEGVPASERDKAVCPKTANGDRNAARGQTEPTHPGGATPLFALEEAPHGKRRLLILLNVLFRAFPFHDACLPNASLAEGPTPHYLPAQSQKVTENLTLLRAIYFVKVPARIAESIATSRDKFHVLLYNPAAFRFRSSAIYMP